MGTGNEAPRVPGKGTDSLPWMLTPLGRGPGAYLSVAKGMGEPLSWWLSGKDATGPSRGGSE